jgi:putative glycosyltransferase
LIFFIGVGLAGLAALGGGLLLLRKVVDPGSISLGWPSLMVSIWFLGGVVIAFLGVIGIYLSKIFTEVKARPLYVVRSLHGGGGPGASAPEQG